MLFKLCYHTVCVLSFNRKNTEFICNTMCKTNVATNCDYCASSYLKPVILNKFRHTIMKDSIAEAKYFPHIIKTIFKVSPSLQHTYMDITFCIGRS